MFKDKPLQSFWGSLLKHAFPSVSLGLIVLIIPFSFHGCGSEYTQEEPKYEEEIGDYQPGTDANTQSMPESNKTELRRVFNTIPTNLTNIDENDSGAVLALASATAYQIVADNCESGYSDTATQSSGNLRLYKYDLECVGRLTSFTHNGVSYSPQGLGFNGNYAVGQTATFENAGATLDLTVEVVTQLSSPVQASDTISYKYYDADALSDKDILTTSITSEQTEAGTPAIPNYNLAIIQLNNITSDEEAQYVFSLECNVSITGTTLCDSVDMDEVRYKFVEDPSPTSITKSWLEAQFPTGESTITDPDDIIATSTTNVENGGFQTVELTSHTGIQNSPKTVLIIQHYHASDPAFRYFVLEMDVGVN